MNVKKKITIAAASAVTVILVAVLILINMFPKGTVTGRLYRVENVYEEIWNMVISEKMGNETILTTSTEGAYVDYDFGFFEKVDISVNDEYRVVLSFHRDELLIYLFSNNDRSDETPLYVYDYQSNILYGNREESYLLEKFTSLYYSWVGDNGNFDPEHQGDYMYVYAEFPLSHQDD